MRRRAVIAVLASLAAAPSALAQTAGKIRRIGVLHWTSGGAVYDDVLKAALRDLGHVEGRDVEYVIRAGDDDAQRAAAMADELVRLQVQVLVATSTGAALAARDATRTIPVVISAADPVTSGLVGNLSRPEANVTGVSLQNIELIEKRLELVHEMVPGLKRLAFVGQQGEPNVERFRAALQRAGDVRGVEILPYLVREAAEFESAFARAVRDGARALVTQPVFHPLARQLAVTAAAHRMPTIGDVRLFAESGGLIAYDVDRVYTWQRVAALVDRILRGASPSDLPVEQSTRTVLVINARTARQLGLAIPPSLLARADEVIE